MLPIRNTIGHALSTYAEVRTRITNELNETDVATDVANAVQSVIREHETTRFRFNEARDFTLTTVVGQAIYTITDASWIPTVVRLDDKAYVTVNSQFRQMRRDEFFDLELKSDNSAAQGQPWKFAYFASTLRLYPIPDAAYPVRFFGVKRLSTLSADSDTNAWTVEGELLTIYAAKRWLLQHVIQDDGYATAMAAAEQAERNRLITEKALQTARGRLTATRF